MDLQLIKQNLSRDYYKNPLQKGEYPPREDIQYLYHECNLTTKPIASILNVSDGKVSTIIKYYGLRKTQEQINYSRSLQWQNYSDEYKKQRIQNVRNGFTKEIRDKLSRNTREYKANKTEEEKLQIIEKFKYTWCHRTQDEIDSRVQKLRDAYHNVSPEDREKITNKFRKTFAETWSKKTVEEKQSYINKMQETKRQNGTFNTSRKENMIYEKLKNIFPSVQRQYKSEVYPFACDFYIPELDLYMEFQGNWTHGGLPYQQGNPICDEQLKHWQEKSIHSQFYINAIDVWTQRDVEKRATAKLNNLNWIEFFSMVDFNVWYSGLTMN